MQYQKTHSLFIASIVNISCYNNNNNENNTKDVI